jgi:LppX_LprAFG lipoprotein
MKLRLVLIGLLAAACVASCGGDDEPESRGAVTHGPDPSSAGVLAEAGEGTLAEGSSRVALDATITGAGGDEQSFSADGAFDFEEEAGRFEFSIDGGEGELLYAGDVVYARLPAGMLPIGDTWVKVDLETLGASVDFAQLAQAGSATPAQYLRWLRAAKDVELVGDEEVRGVPTTHHRGVIDVNRLIEEQPDLRRSLQALDLDEVPTDVWIDEEGLIRRVTQEYELGSAEAKTSTTVTMELYDFGVEVNAEAPGPEEVFDVSDLIGGSS